ncbi:MAG: hypothetical protein J6R82_03420 [Clostridia bacterium]|nr:hypothetical protein [Clostridia bacterium]
MKFLKLRMWWSDKTTFEKVLEVIQILLALVVIVAAILTLSNVWDGFALVFPPVFAVQCLINAYQYWNEKRKMAIFELCTGIFIAVVSIVMLVLEIALH